MSYLSKSKWISLSTSAATNSFGAGGCAGTGAGAGGTGGAGGARAPPPPAAGGGRGGPPRAGGPPQPSWRGAWGNPPARLRATREQPPSILDAYAGSSHASSFDGSVLHSLALRRLLGSRRGRGGGAPRPGRGHHGPPPPAHDT